MGCRRRRRQNAGGDSPRCVVDTVAYAITGTARVAGVSWSCGSAPVVVPSNDRSGSSRIVQAVVRVASQIVAYQNWR